MSKSRTVGETTIGSRYQAVITSPARKIARKIKPGEKASVIPIDQYSVIVSIKPESWTMATYAMDRGVWSKVNVKKYLEELRKEDENRPV